MNIFLKKKYPFFISAAVLSAAVHTSCSNSTRFSGTPKDKNHSATTDSKELPVEIPKKQSPYPDPSINTVHQPLLPADAKARIQDHMFFEVEDKGGTSTMFATLSNTENTLILNTFEVLGDTLEFQHLASSRMEYHHTPNRQLEFRLAVENQAFKVHARYFSEPPTGEPSPVRYTTMPVIQADHQSAINQRIRRSLHFTQEIRSTETAQMTQQPQSGTFTRDSVARRHHRRIQCSSPNFNPHNVIHCHSIHKDQRSKSQIFYLKLQEQPALTK